MIIFTHHAKFRLWQMDVPLKLATDMIQNAEETGLSRRMTKMKKHKYHGNEGIRYLYGIGVLFTVKDRGNDIIVITATERSIAGLAGKLK